MINEEFNLFDDSSESSEHANLPRVLILHEKPRIFNSPKINLAQSLKLTRSDDLINKFNKKEEEEKVDKGNNQNLKNNNTKYRNNKELQIINLDDKILFENENFTHRKTMKYEKVLLKTNPNMNNSGIENRRSCLLKTQRVKFNKSNDFNNLKLKKMGKIFETKKRVHSLRNSDVLPNKKMVKKKSNGRNLIKNISKEKIKDVNSEMKSKINNMNTLNIKSNIIKEDKMDKFFKSSKVLSSFNFDLSQPKKKANKNKKNNNGLALNNNIKKVHKKIKNSNTKPRLTLPTSRDKKIKKEKKENTKEKVNNINSNLKNKIKIRIKKEIDYKNNTNISSNFSSRKTYKTEKNNIKQINKNNINGEKKMKLVRSLKNILREENKFNIKNHCVLSKAGRDEFGHLKINQDTYLFIKEINGIKNFDIFGVLDGHGPEGHFVSQLVSRYIQLEFQKIKAIERIKDVKIIYQKLSANNFSIIKDIFINADNFLRDQEIESRSSGTTCVLVIHIGNHIICANVGDSRAILIYDKNKDHDYKVFPLSIDNKPEMKEERERITKMGGKVEKIKNKYGKEIGPFRVWDKARDFPGLAMSRSIGDFNGKNIGIIPDPEIIETDFKININYIVICSDGVWEFLNNEDIMNFGNKYYEENNPRGFCKEIVEYSTKCWQKDDAVIDDITILTVFF